MDGAVEANNEVRFIDLFVGSLKLFILKMEDLPTTLPVTAQNSEHKTAKRITSIKKKSDRHVEYIENKLKEYNQALAQNDGDSKEQIEKKIENYYKCRQAIVEHPYGTIKRQWEFSYISTKKTIERASDDIGFMMTAYSLRRIINLIGLNE